jgi:hypothetical protein
MLCSRSAETGEKSSKFEFYHCLWSLFTQGNVPKVRGGLFLVLKMLIYSSFYGPRCWGLQSNGEYWSNVDIINS